nr:MAG TPA: hypothetical protein [Caudoviricetes sp.]
MLKHRLIHGYNGCEANIKRLLYYPNEEGSRVFLSMPY